MHTVIINGKKRIVDSKELKTIQVVYRGAIEIVEETPKPIEEVKVIEIEPKKIKPKKIKEDELIS